MVPQFRSADGKIEREQGEEDIGDDVEFQQDRDQILRADGISNAHMQSGPGCKGGNPESGAEGLRQDIIHADGSRRKVELKKLDREQKGDAEAECREGGTSLQEQAAPRPKG